MKNLKKNFKAFLKDESAQGMVEYILILVAVIGFVMILRTRLKGTIETGLGNVDQGVSGFQVEQ
jgi:Flp pilus assembly pilin Flp